MTTKKPATPPASPTADLIPLKLACDAIEFATDAWQRGVITDLYRDDEDVIGHDQTIVFATHDSIGHLGIFVSGSVGRKEHREFAENIDLIDLLPAGIYRAEVEGRPEAGEVGEQADDPCVMTIRRSDVGEVRAIVKPDPASERRFAAAARISEINLALYRSLAQPWVQALFEAQDKGPARSARTTAAPAKRRTSKPAKRGKTPGTRT